MEQLPPLLPQDALSPDGIQFIAWLMSLVKETNSPLAAAANLDIGLALKEKLPWIDDPDLDEAHQRLLEVLARLALSLFQNTFEISHLRCCTALLKKAMKGCVPGDVASLSRLRQLYAQALYQSFLREPREETLDEAIEMAEDSVRCTEMLLVERKLDLWTCLFQKARLRDGDDKRTFLKRSVRVAEEVYNYVKSNEGSHLWASSN